MPKAKNPITDEERSRRFEEEVKKRKAAGNFDPDIAEMAVDRLASRARSKDGRG
jgi:chorismate mutase